MQNYIIQGNFTAGELSPLLRGRADTEMFFNGASELRNCVVLTQGGVQRRSGTKNLRLLKPVASKVRLFRMQMTDTEAYIIQMTDNAFTVIDAFTDKFITTVTGHPYALEEFDEVTSYQSADVLFLAHKNHPTAKLSNYGGTDWRYSVCEFSNGPFMDRAPDEADTPLAISEQTDRMTVTSTASDYAGVTAGDYIEYVRAGTHFLGVVTNKLSDSSVIIRPLEDKCFSLSKEVYSPGTYLSWDGDNGIPVYGAIPTSGHSGKVAFSAVNVVTRDTIGGYIRFLDEVGTIRWMQVSQIDDILQAGSYGVLAIGTILTVKMPSTLATQFTSERIVTARMYSGRPTFFSRKNDMGRVFRLSYGDTTVFAKVINSSSVSFTRKGSTTVGSNFIAMPDITDVMEGLPVSNAAFPAGTFVTKRQAYKAAEDLYDEDVKTYYVHGGAIINKSFKVLIGTTPEVPSGVYVSAAATSAVTLQEIVFGADDTGSDSAGSVAVKLSRTIPVGISGAMYNNGMCDAWWKGAFYAQNYPSVVTIHEERLILASTPAQPQTIWMSGTGDYYNFAPVNEQTEQLDNYSITVTLGSPQLERIAWMSTKNQLCLGTTGGEWIVGSGTQRLPLTPKNVSAQMQTAYGSSFNSALDVGRETLFIQCSGDRIRQMRFDYATDGYLSKDMTLRSDHILSKYGGAKEIVFAQAPQSRLFVRCGSGDVLAFTYEPDQEVFAWSHFLSGKCTSLVSVRRNMASVLYMDMVRNDVSDGKLITSHYLETIDLGATSDYADCLTGIAGERKLRYPAFAGADVVFITDTQHSSPVRCSATGATDIPEGFAGDTTLRVGLPYETVITTFPVEAQSQLGPGLGRFQSIVSSLLRLHESGGFEYAVLGGPYSSASTEKSLRKYYDDMDQSVALSCDDVEVQHTPNIGPKQCIQIKTSRPWPLNVLAMCHKIDQK